MDFDFSDVQRSWREKAQALGAEFDDDTAPGDVIAGAARVGLIDPKADLVAALKDAVAYCNKSFDSMTDAKGSQMVKFMNFDVAKLTVFSINTAHTDEHYGNMVTYLRMKGIVPPTSENPPGAWTLVAGIILETGSG